jgi:hypothetical protein
MLSKASVARPWINFEAGAAWLAKKPIIPACFGGLTKDTLPKPYSGIQALNLPDDLDYLVKSVARHLSPDAIGPPPFFHKSYAYRIVAAGCSGKRYLPPRVDQVWTDDTEDDVGMTD